MTTTVTVDAHCGDDTEVIVTVTDFGAEVEEFTLQDGESDNRFVYDGREIVVKEYPKA